MGVPHNQNATPHAGFGRSEAHPLSNPLGKIVHAVHLSSIDLFKVRLMDMGGFVGGYNGLGYAVVQGLIQDAVGRRKGLHTFSAN
jgi:hypothetical protein